MFSVLLLLAVVDHLEQIFPLPKARAVVHPCGSSQGYDSTKAVPIVSSRLVAVAPHQLPRRPAAR